MKLVLLAEAQRRFEAEDEWWRAGLLLALIANHDDVIPGYSLEAMFAL